MTRLGHASKQNAGNFSIVQTISDFRNDLGEKSKDLAARDCTES